MFINYHKQFKRSKRLRGRPEWQDMVPDTKEQRDLYKIADKHVDKFSRAFMAMTRSLIDDNTAKLIKDAWNAGSTPQEIESLIPIFAEGATDDEKVWRRFVNQIDNAYFDLVDESGEDETKRLNKKLKTNLGFTMQADVEPEEAEIIKAKKKVPIVPVNPYSLKWIQERALELIKTGLTKSQRDVIREVLLDAQSKGLRGKQVLDLLQQNLGLTARDFKAVQRRFKLHMESGIPKAKVDSLTMKYRDKLIKRRAQNIARTETIAAQAQGRNTAWQLAKESGQLPEVKRIWITAPSSPNPNRPCDICEGLDGAEATLTEPYESDVIGFVQMPPAHPSCRCTETIVKIKA